MNNSTTYYLLLAKTRLFLYPLIRRLSRLTELSAAAIRGGEEAKKQTKTPTRRGILMRWCWKTSALGRLMHRRRWTLSSWKESSILYPRVGEKARPLGSRALRRTGTRNWGCQENIWKRPQAESGRVKLRVPTSPSLSVQAGTDEPSSEVGAISGFILGL